MILFQEEKKKTINYNNIKMLPIICYEIIYSGNLNMESKKFDLIVNLFEDGWRTNPLVLISIFIILNFEL